MEASPTSNSGARLTLAATARTANRTFAARLACRPPHPTRNSPDAGVAARASPSARSSVGTEARPRRCMPKLRLHRGGRGEGRGCFIYGGVEADFRPSVEVCKDSGLNPQLFVFNFDHQNPPQFQAGTPLDYRTPSFYKLREILYRRQDGIPRERECAWLM